MFISKISSDRTELELTLINRTSQEDQKILADAQKQSSAEEVPVTGEVPPQSTTAPVTVTDPSGNNSRAVPTIYDSILNSFQTVESVATLFTDPSGNYMYTDSDPLALFNLISRINDTYGRN